MPAKSKKQLNFFKLVKAYVDGGPEGVMGMWKELYPKRKLPTSEQLEKIIKIADNINYADLEDLASGVEGDDDLGEKRDLKVGYWMKFESWFTTHQGHKRKATFIAKITRVRNDISLVNFNSEDIYSELGNKMTPVRKPKITHPDFIWLDYAYFDQIKKTAKDKKDLIMRNEEVRKIVKNTLMEVFYINEAEKKDTGGVKIKKRNSDEEVSVKTNMHVQSATDETSKGIIKNVGINYKVTPNKNNLRIKWYHGDKSGTEQTVDLEDVVAM